MSIALSANVFKRALQKFRIKLNTISNGDKVKLKVIR